LAHLREQAHVAGVCVSDSRAVDSGGGAIVLVEDDLPTARSLARVLETRGYQVCIADTVADARLLVGQSRPDLILLDLVLPDGDGLVALPALRALTDAPIIVCSARQQQVDRVLGLKLGADDFVGKPYDLDELEARVEAVLRRSARAREADAGPPERIALGDLVISPARVSVTLGGQPVPVTRTEYHLLLALASHPGEVVSREALGQSVWGYADFGTGHVVDVHIGRLRAKLRQAAPDARPVVETVRGRGYTLALTRP
jgi:DNA-binding response OmpR family regulator